MPKPTRTPSKKPVKAAAKPVAKPKRSLIKAVASAVAKKVAAMRKSAPAKPAASRKVAAAKAVSKKPAAKVSSKPVGKSAKKAAPAKPHAKMTKPSVKQTAKKTIKQKPVAKKSVAKKPLKVTKAVKTVKKATPVKQSGKAVAKPVVSKKPAKVIAVSKAKAAPVKAPRHAKPEAVAKPVVRATAITEAEIQASAAQTISATPTKPVKGGRKGKGMHQIMPPAAAPLDMDTRRLRLKNLIALGKERGYLTYAEINDHLPDDLVDAEQIESIITTFNDMSIKVFDEAPAAEELLLTDAVSGHVDQAEVEEQAEQALSTVDSEFGRTTDPVRMYMREMGTVELLTREGEIEIAKRIEDGLKHMVMAISACPTTVAEMLGMAAKVARDEMRVDELIDGLIDPNALPEDPTTMAEELDMGDGEDEDDEDGSRVSVHCCNSSRMRLNAFRRSTSFTAR